MYTSETTTKIWGAMLAAQSAIGPVEKNGVNPRFKNRYATIEDILAAIRKPCLNAGVVLVQYVENGVLLTRCTHAETGEFIETQTALAATNQDAQAMGSAITYARRYALAPLFCIHDGDNDDDGNAAQPATKKTTTTLAPKPQSKAQQHNNNTDIVYDFFDADAPLDEITDRDELAERFKFAKTQTERDAIMARVKELGFGK